MEALQTKTPYSKLKSYVANVNEIILDKIEGQLEGKFQKPWVEPTLDGKLPYNAFSDTGYEMFNTITLSEAQHELGYNYSGWMTYMQAQKLGGQVRKGSKGAFVLFRDVIFRNAENNAKISKSDVQNAKAQGVNVEVHQFLKEYHVFNVDCIDGLPEKFYVKEEKVDLPEPERDDKAELLLHSSGAKIHWQNIDRAYYSLSKDGIFLPQRYQFRNTIGLYMVAFHELGHWTGHPQRLNRKFGAGMHTDEYAFEELVAELFSVYACNYLGLEHNMTDNAIYLKNWWKALKMDKYYFFRASQLALRAFKYVLNQVVQAQEDPEIAPF